MQLFEVRLRSYFVLGFQFHRFNFEMNEQVKNTKEFSNSAINLRDTSTYNSWRLCKNNEAQTPYFSRDWMRNSRKNANYKNGIEKWNCTMNKNSTVKYN